MVPEPGAAGHAEQRDRRGHLWSRAPATIMGPAIGGLLGCRFGNGIPFAVSWPVRLPDKLQPRWRWGRQRARKSRNPGRRRDPGDDAGRLQLHLVAGPKMAWGSDGAGFRRRAVQHRHGPVAVLRDRSVLRRRLGFMGALRAAALATGALLMAALFTRYPLSSGTSDPGLLLAVEVSMGLTHGPCSVSATKISSGSASAF